MKRTLVLALAISVMLFVSACSHMPDNANASADNSSAATTADNSGSSSALPFSGDKDRPSSEHKGLFSRKAEDLTVPSGTPVTVRLSTAVSSASNQAGDRFDAVLDAPLVVNGKTIAPAGAAVTGRVVAAEQSGHLQHPGMIQIALDTITINNKAVPVTTSSVIARGTSHKKRNLAWIGGSTAGGALIGGLAGGGKGALIGSMVGAGGGTTAAYATGKKDVGFGVERRLTFRITQPVTVKG
ncbi:MAG: hypothetical protein ROO76_21685 [Terriglobia bacterium]|nr:hypothetical protein [Terriglobia bacterium]